MWHDVFIRDMSHSSYMPTPHTVSVSCAVHTKLLYDSLCIHRSLYVCIGLFVHTLLSFDAHPPSSQNSIWDCYGSFDEQRLFSVHTLLSFDAHPPRYHSYIHELASIENSRDATRDKQKPWIMSHVTFMNELCHEQWVMSNVCTSYVTNSLCRELASIENLRDTTRDKGRPCIMGQCHMYERVTGWRRLIGSPKLQIIFHKRATKYRSLLRKMTYKDKGFYESSHPVCHE